MVSYILSSCSIPGSSLGVFHSPTQHIAWECENWRAVRRRPSSPSQERGSQPSVLWEWQKSELEQCLQSLGIWDFSNDPKRISCWWSINHTLRNNSLEDWSFRLNRDLPLWTCSLWGHMWADCIYCLGVGKCDCWGIILESEAVCFGSFHLFSQTKWIIYYKRKMVWHAN